MFENDFFGPKKGFPFNDLFFEEFDKSSSPPVEHNFLADENSLPILDDSNFEILVT